MLFYNCAVPLSSNDPQRPLAWHILFSNQTELKIIFCLLPIISFARSLSLGCCSLVAVLLRGALSVLISCLQPLCCVSWRRHCIYLCIYGPATPRPLWGVCLLFTLGAFLSIHIRSFFLWRMKRATYFFSIWLPLMWSWRVSFPLW